MPSVSQSVLATLAALQGVNAWGALGHATVAYIGQHYVSPETASWAQGILGDTSGDYLATIASWADEFRATADGKWSAPFHFIDAEDNPPSSCNVDYDRDCGSSGCSIAAMANYTQRVTDSRLDSSEITNALKFLVHFTGDMTQPLHDEAYKLGGNGIKVMFDGFKDNLHADWDTYIPEKKVGGGNLSDASTWAQSLIQEIDSGSFKSQAADWIKGDDIKDVITTTGRWASDANAFVCTVVMPQGEAALEKGDLYPTYYNSVIDTVELQIAKGGYRLGNWLNMIHSSTTSNNTTKCTRKAKPLPDLLGRDLLPAARPMSRAKMAREAMGGSCCGSEGGHHHH